MLRYKKVESDKLSDQFNIDEDFFEETADKWMEAQRGINKTCTEGMKAHEEGMEFDARTAMEGLFNIFNTQKSQDILLLQLVMKEIQERGHHAAAKMMDEDGGMTDIGKMMKELLSEKLKEKGNDNDEVDFEELL